MRKLLGGAMAASPVVALAVTHGVQIVAVLASPHSGIKWR